MGVGPSLLVIAAIVAYACIAAIGRRTLFQS